MSSTYSTISDLFVGDITIDTATKQQHVDRAADEVDSRLGFMYVTPFTQGALSRPGWLFIQRLANFIASGRLLLEIDQAGEGMMIHAYGKRLLDDAEECISYVLDGKIDLLPTDPSDPDIQAVHGATVRNLDPYSQVEAFYGWASIPAWATPSRSGYFRAG